MKYFYGSYDYAEIWTANFDGSSQQKINIQLPSGIVIMPEQPNLSPDKKLIFFTAFVAPQGKSSVYSCNLDGSNVKEIVDSTTGTYGVGNAILPIKILYCP